MCVCVCVCVYVCVCVHAQVCMTIICVLVVTCVQILARDHPRYKWVAILVELFIMVSITVSYLTIGGALHHACQYYP